MLGAYVYILTNDRQTALYTGSTNELRNRVRHHKHRLVPGFTRRYNVHRLVYFETLSGMDAARIRERQIKGLMRAKKEALINAANPAWRDLYPHTPS
jgi:putative endonuclease